MSIALSSTTPLWNRDVQATPDVFRVSPFEYDTTVPIEQVHRPSFGPLVGQEVWDLFDLMTPPELTSLKLELRLNDPQQLELHRES